LSFLESKYLYFGLLLFSIAYPLAQSFEWRICYYTKWKRLFPAIIVMTLIFIPWDIWFTKVGVWWFNDDYITGIKIFGLPIEEWLFFVVVPFACMFIYEVIIYFIKKDLLFKYARPIFLILAILLAIGAIVFYKQLYPLVTFSLTSIALFATVYFNPKWKGRFLMMYLVSWIPFLFVNGALTGNFTKTATVNYNSEEIIGLRITTIPVEDSVYNLLMLLIVVAIYEFQNNSSINSTLRE
jgi:lycopene cyclase domain-containing protein